MTILALAFAWLADGHADDDTTESVLKVAFFVDLILAIILS
jgi:hypothetical protein